MPEIETGLPIMRRTACRVGAHAFTWTDGHAESARPPDPMMRCDCGAVTWEKASGTVPPVEVIA